MPTSGDRIIFTLAEACAMLPRVKHVTADAVRRAESLASRLHGTAVVEPEHAVLADELRSVVTGWADELRSLGAEPKGLWLVDFDNGDGYYCWSYPEPGIAHYHGYSDGFAGRMKIQ